MIPPLVLPLKMDIYRSPNNGNPIVNPSNQDPAYRNVACNLIPNYVSAARMMNPNLKTWTYYLLCQPNTDIRDGYNGANNWNINLADTIIIPSGQTTQYVVVFVEYRGRSTIGAHLRVYCDRIFTGWPYL